MLLQPPPLAIYVHIPWCVRKCPYCDFNSHAAPAQLPQAHYIEALLADLDLDLPAVSDRELVAMFIGGGTPSLFDPSSIASLIAAVRARLTCSTALEVTLEANPGTIERGRFAEYRSAGITRVSLGVQSFEPRHLQSLGRIHDSAEIFAAVAELAAAGLDNFNLDLMYGLPQQSLSQALSDVRNAVSLRPSHISHYQLTLEPGTVFHHRPPPGLPDDDVTWEMQVRCQQLLAEHGYTQYEVSAYSRPGWQCRHNLNYWQFGDYLGVGAGAHGKLSNSRGVTRTIRRKQPREYLNCEPADRVARYPVDPQALPFEFMLNSLRLVEGFSLRAFEARTGVAAPTIMGQLTAAVHKGLLEATDGNCYKPSQLGMRFLNDLQAMFL